ncbi:Predicted ATPase [Azotobacter beijerinckii]|uniref:Predicted ATPase n=1 Tax=Azotobacter beijerinckii TaxID=170623 RepID=A0A1H9I3N5_9GAMM|nr:ATP-binding protein [Azotobacter beijerinckii]SEQ69173.1 Predicted ATPase [Azotobacter beijerinckii]
MLTAIHIKGFKSYRDQRLQLSPLTLMIGANASGKSNALEAFRFLCWLGQGQKLSVLRHRVDDSEQILRGQVRDLPYLQSQSFTLGCETDDEEWNSLSVEIVLRDDELHIVQESIGSSRQKFPLYRIEQPSSGLSTDVRVAYNNFARGGQKPQITCTDQIAILNQLASSAMFDSGHKKAQKVIPETTGHFQRLLANTLFLDPVPALMRGDSPPDKTLRGDCANLSGVLYTLWQDQAVRPAIIAFIKSLPEQDVKDVRFFEDRRGRVSLELVESFGEVERNWSVELLSDGTLRVLAIAAALLSAPMESTLVIEEVDNGVHPSRARQLLNTMREQAEQRGVRLLLTTHNPALMDALPDSALGDVVFCYRDSAQGDSRLVRLSDLQDYAGLVSQGPLGELVTNGIVDRFVKSPVTPEQKRRNALAWLQKMQGEIE